MQMNSLFLFRTTKSIFFIGISILSLVYCQRNISDNNSSIEEEFFILWDSTALSNGAITSMIPYSQNNLFVGVHHYDDLTVKVYNTIDLGISWSIKLADIPFGPCMLGSNSQNHIFALIADILYKSVDGGFTWGRIFSDYKFDNFVINSKDQIFLSMPINSIYYSKDNGENIEFLFEISSGHKIYCDEQDILYLPNHNGTIIYRSLDDGLNWDELELPFKMITDFFFDDKNSAFAGGIDSNLYHSKDNCETWEAIYKLPSQIKYIFVDNYNQIYVWLNNTSGYVSIDFGKSWNKLSSNIEYHVSVTPVQVGDTIFIGTTNRGVLKKTYSGELLD